MHRMSDWDMARVLPAPPVRSGQGFGHQPRERDRLELNLLTNLHPNRLLTARQRYLIEEVGLDGHWLITAATYYIRQGMVELGAPYHVFERQMESFIEFLFDVLRDDIVAACEAEGQTDDQLQRIDAWVVEYMPDLMTGVEYAIGEIYNVMASYSAPEFCKYRTIDRYFVGYSMEKNYGGILHFYFKDD